MFSHKPSRNSSPTSAGGSSCDPLRKRLSSAFQVLVHGDHPSQSTQPQLDPRIVAGIDRLAEGIAETYNDPLAGSFARDVMTESAYVIVDSFGVPSEEKMREAAQNEATADLLAQAPRETK